MTTAVRGELWTVAGGTYASKPRPAAIIQSDHFSALDSVVVVPCTTTAIDAPLLRVPLAADAVSGIGRDSWLMLDKVTTVRRSNLGERLGRLSDQQLAEVTRGVMVVLGAAD